MHQIVCIPSRKDNYIWLIKKGALAVVIDPGEAEPVLARLAALELELHAILLTHHHHDHVDGVPQLQAAFPECRLYGPDEPALGLPGLVRLADGQQLNLPALGLSFEVLHLPGHTLSHIAYWGQGWLFCGDVLFSAGCGRLLGGTASQMFHSLQRLKRLPAETLVYCAHEYTQSNLAFGQQIEPDNPALLARLRQVARLRQQGVPTLPSTLGDELSYNVFLRTEEPEVIAAAQLFSSSECENEIQIFASLREKKNNS